MFGMTHAFSPEPDHLQHGQSEDEAVRMDRYHQSL